MANRNDYFFEQTVTEAELDDGFSKLEDADFKIMSDQLLQGIFQGAEVTEQLSPSLNVDVNGPSLVYDQTGRRIFWSPVQVVNAALDENNNSTAVVTPGNAKVLSLFAQFDRLLSDPRIDGNSVTVFFNRDEFFKLNIVQGAEATSGSEVAPPLRADQILLCDITILQGTTQIFDADIDLLTRRQDTFVITGTPNNVRAGTVLETLQDFQDQINTFIGGTFVQLGVVNAFTAMQHSTVEALADGANISLDVELGNVFEVTLGGNRTLDNPTNVIAGMTWIVIVNNDATPGRTLAFGGNYDFGFEGAPDLSGAAASETNIISCVALSPTQIASTTLKGFA